MLQKQIQKRRISNVHPESPNLLTGEKKKKKKNSKKKIFISRQNQTQKSTFQTQQKIHFVHCALDVRSPELQIFTDNQAAIQIVANPRRQSGQNILRQACLIITKLTNLGTRTTITWIPADVGDSREQNGQPASKRSYHRVGEKTRIGADFSPIHPVNFLFYY